MQTTCLYCSEGFEPDRSDAKFCSERCKAAYFRNCGATGTHADLERFKSKHCEYCGHTFWFNAYGDRSVKRIPTYCTDRCRVAAWRVRKASARQRERTAEQEPRSWERAQRNQREARQEEPRQRTAGFRTGDFRDTLTVPRRWSEADAKIWLGVPFNADKAECAKVWRELNKKYHPDQNAGSVWPHLVHVNAAYDYLKRNLWKRR